MGCGLLALDLLRNWKFIEPSEDGQSTNESISDRKSSDDDDESSVDEEEKEVPMEIRAKPPPKLAFEEPSPSSLLDSFGY